MNKFIIQILFFSLLVGASIFLLFLQANGRSDDFYVSFTTPKQRSLILGTSRAAQGIRPDILNERLGRSDLYNYSFTLRHSPYGKVYLDSIQKKLKPLEDEEAPRIFILAVDPWSISSICTDPDDEKNFRENEQFLKKLAFVNQKPNIQYLFEFYPRRLFRLILGGETETFLHSNGWLEVDVPMDEKSLSQRYQNKVKEYREKNLVIYKPSKVREQYMERLIELLKRKGHVYLVRLPVDEGIMNVEVMLMPDFNEKMKNLAERMSLDYFDLTYLNDQMVYTDGNHLHKDSAKEVTKIIADNILDNLSDLDKGTQNVVNILEGSEV